MMQLKIVVIDNNIHRSFSRRATDESIPRARNEPVNILYVVNRFHFMDFKSRLAKDGRTIFLSGSIWVHYMVGLNFIWKRIWLVISWLLFKPNWFTPEVLRIWFIMLLFNWVPQQQSISDADLFLICEVSQNPPKFRMLTPLCIMLLSFFFRGTSPGAKVLSAFINLSKQTWYFAQ